MENDLETALAQISATLSALEGAVHMLVNSNLAVQVLLAQIRNGEAVPPRDLPALVDEQIELGWAIERHLQQRARTV